MATKVIVRAVPGGLQCVNQVEGDKLENLLGQEVVATITRPRNLQFHRKLFALLGVGREMASTEFNPEQFRAYCIAGAGYCDYIEHNGKLVAVPKSISFANMDDVEFQALYSAVLNFICETWVLDHAQIAEIVTFM
jgi:hypothetical protein